ncbi:hypothetical protein [Fructilactobacillus lindneri]|uniref:hypothetical protein n=1 Tax=Fructilactobacillus lindneri TaxID=53444 RepID=UPI000CD40C3F|nr:hypothetical protein [Fructilactobacillus lindneri]POH04367.1 hypothetical protein BGL33_07055 [Fructilactobacillus lindneri]
MIKNRKNYSTDPIEPLFYIFLGQDLNEDENCFLNCTNKVNGYYVKFGKYFIDSKIENDSTKTQFTKQKVELIRRRLKWLWIDDSDVIPVFDVDEDVVSDND